MQRPQLTTRRLLALVAALALIFGLVAGLRRERFRSQSAEYASAYKAVYKGGSDFTMEGYHAALAAKYKAAANRPWLPVEADPEPLKGVKDFWLAHAAVTKAYPGVKLDDYIAQVSGFTGWQGHEAPEGRTTYAIRYRRRDGRSGMNVIVADPVEIPLHSDGPPPAPPGPRGE